MLFHKKIRLFLLFLSWFNFPKQAPKDSVQHVQALPPDQRVKVTPLSQLKDSGRVEQSDSKLFLNFIIKGVKTLYLMVAVVKINCSIMGKKGLKSHNNYIHFDVYEEELLL